MSSLVAASHLHDCRRLSFDAGGFFYFGYCGVYPRKYPKTISITFQFVSDEGLKRLVLLIEFKSVSKVAIFTILSTVNTIIALKA